MTDEPESVGTEAGDFTAQVVTHGHHALIALKGWEASARQLKTPMLWVDFEPFCVKRLCRASNGAWAWRDVTASDSVAELRAIKGEK